MGQKISRPIRPSSVALVRQLMFCDGQPTVLVSPLICTVPSPTGLTLLPDSTITRLCFTSLCLLPKTQGAQMRQMYTYSQLLREAIEGWAGYKLPERACASQFGCGVAEV